MSVIVQRATNILQSGNGWNNVANAIDTNLDSYAYKKANSNSACHVNGFSFNIPTVATIEKVVVYFKAYISNKYGYFSGFLYTDTGSNIKSQIFIDRVAHTTPTYFSLEVSAAEIQSKLDSLNVYDKNIFTFLKSGVRVRWVGGAANSSILSSECRVYDTYVEVHYTLPTYYLDLNGMLDGKSSGGISPYGTADIYINGSRVSQGVSDYYTAHEYGTTYEIKNIKANDGYQYDGVYSGSLSGTLTAAIAVVLSFSTKASPPKFTTAAITYSGVQVSSNNKVPIGEGYLIAIGVS